MTNFPSISNNFQISFADSNLQYIVCSWKYVTEQKDSLLDHLLRGESWDTIQDIMLVLLLIEMLQSHKHKIFSFLC